MKAARFGLVLALTLYMLAGCRAWHERACHKPQPYMSAQSVAPLNIPPGIDTPDHTNELRVPKLDAPAPPPRKGKDPCLDEPPPYKVAKPPPAPQA